jgi:hypothetical protein
VKKENASDEQGDTLPRRLKIENTSDKEDVTLLVA